MMPSGQPLSHEELLKAYNDLDENSKILVQTDLELHKAKAEVDSQVSKLILLNKLSDLIHASRDTKHILKTVCESLVADLGFEKAWIFYREGKNVRPALIEYGAAPSERPQLLQLAEHCDAIAKDKPDQIRFDIDAQDQDARIRGLLDAVSAAELVRAPLVIHHESHGGICAARLHTYPPLTPSDLSFFVMLSRQVSIALENVRMHQEILENNQRLEERVAIRSKELVEANARLMELDRVKSNFISLVSHELRTPMTAIKGFASLLIDFESRMEAHQRHSYVVKINEECDRLSRLIADLLNISRIESGRMVIRWQEVKLPVLIQHAFEQQTIQKVPVRFRMHIAPHLPSFVADSDKLEQVIINLVANAARFTPPAQEVSVVADTENEDIRIRVINPGEGIAFADLTKIFDKFYRVENEVNRKNRGTGLGLSICRGLVAMHGGRVWAESEPNKETTFTILLPRNLDKLTLPLEERPHDSRTKAA